MSVIWKIKVIDFPGSVQIIATYLATCKMLCMMNFFTGFGCFDEFHNKWVMT